MQHRPDLEALRRRIGGEGSSKDIDNPDTLIDIHHLLMKEYGWIPLEEFKALPLPTVWNLLACIKKQHDAEKKAMRKR